MKALLFYPGSRTAVAILVAAFLAINLGGCTASSNFADDGKIHVVSSTNVWADIASEIGGDFIDVKTIIDNPKKDPHSYEASARDQLSINTADLIITNGGGYDSFMANLINARKTEVVAPILIATGNLTAQATANEHVWYSFSKTKDFATIVAQTLAKLDPGHQTEFEKNLDEFVRGIDALVTKSAAIAKETSGARLIASEAIADYLLTDIGLINVTPTEFSKAIEEERDIPPTVLKKMENLLRSRNIRFVALNNQTSSASINWLTSLAKTTQTQSIYFTESVPSGQTYLTWMDENLSNIKRVTDATRT